MTTSVSAILDWARFYIPDRKTKIKIVRNEEIGITATPTGTRETFYVKRTPIGSVSLYVEPYTYSSVASLKAAATNAKVFMWASSTLSCTFSTGTVGVAYKPKKFKRVLANYEFNEAVPYSYGDTELVSYLPTAIQYLNNNFNTNYSYTYSGATLNLTPSTDGEKEIFSKALAIIVRRNFVEEQKKRGLGIRFRGGMQSIDTVAQLKHYSEETDKLEEQIETKLNDGTLTNAGQSIDVYTEDVVTS